MKLAFKKDAESKISVSQKIGNQEKEFSYIDMIKSLIDTKVMEQPEISGEFTAAEITSINNMTKFINDEISTKEI